MSMDDVLKAVEVFGQDLEVFTARVAAAATALERQNESLISIADTDSAYRQSWQIWRDDLMPYLDQEAPRLQGLVDDKVMLMRKYLYG